MRYFRTLIFILLLPVTFISFACAQENSQDTVKKAKINWDNADIHSIIKIEEGTLHVFRGKNLVFRHGGSYMYCDSAHLYEDMLLLEAFNNVRLEQGDTLFVYGDRLFYDGNTELARIRHNVRMVNISQDSSVVTLYTDSLDYNRQTDIGYYFEGGRIVDLDNELVSVYGQYCPGTKIAAFNDSVRLTNPQFVLYSDTLEYSTEAKVATILGPSVIESDSGIIHTSRGWYDTQENTSLLLDRSEVLSGGRFLTGDSLAYDRNIGLGRAYGNMSILDTAQNVLLTGHYGYYEEKTEYSFATDSACAIEYSQGDTLFLHGDTLQLITIDSTSRDLRAFMGVRFYRFDIQGICDSMRFSTKDSILYMYGTPVLWNEEHQVFGDSILIYMSDSAVDFVHIPTSAFVVQEVDSGYYNQLGGNDMKAYFNGKNIQRIDIDGNAESIYYPFDKDSVMTGLNYMQGSSLSILFDEGKLNRFAFYNGVTALLTPIPDLVLEQKTLKKFAWYGGLRPKDRYDIFRFYNSKKKMPDVEIVDSDNADDHIFTDSPKTIPPVEGMEEIIEE